MHHMSGLSLLREHSSIFFITPPEGKAHLMEAPIVSIITRTRNRALLLRRAADSIMGQAGAPPWEWIIVNDAGKRKAVEEIASAAQTRFPDRVKLLHLEASGGMEHASNAGLRLAKGHFVAIHDDDDSWESGFLRKMAGWMDAPGRESFAGVVCHSTRIVEEVIDGAIRTIDQNPFNDSLREIKFWEMLQMNRYPPISFLFRREILKECGGFDEGLPVLGDWEFNLRVLARYPVGLLPERLANYHHRPPRETGAYANSITQGHRRHREMEKRLRAGWARGNPFGFSLHPFAEAAAIAGHLHEMKSALDRLDKRLVAIPKTTPPQF